jgi:signal peptidase I
MKCGHNFATVLPTAPVAVHPPRAGKWQKKIRKIAGVYQMEDGLEAIKNKIQPESWLTAMVISVVPGLGHYLYGRKLQGMLLAGGWWLLLCFTLFFWGYLLAQLTVAGLLFLHIYCLLDAGRPLLPEQSLTKRCKIFAVATFVLLVCFYVPLHMTRRALVEDVVIAYDTRSTVFIQGDMLLVNKYFCKHERLRRGDLVMYAMDGQRINPGEVGIPNVDYVYIPLMRVIDRILGVAGDKVAFTENGIYVNDEKLPDEDGPVNSRELPRDAIFVVPPGHYCVYPSCLRATYPHSDREYPSMGIKLQQSIVVAKKISGKVFMLYCPLSRRRFL